MSIDEEAIHPQQGETLSFDIYIPALGQHRRIQANVVGIYADKYGHDQLGLAFNAETQDEKRTITALVYGWSELSEYNQNARQKRITPLSGLTYLSGTAMYHAGEHIIFLTREYTHQILNTLRNKLSSLRAKSSPEHIS